MENGGFGNAVLDETNTLQLRQRTQLDGWQTSTEVEVAEPLQPEAPLILIGQLRRIRTLSEKTQDLDICQFSL